MLLLWKLLRNPSLPRDTKCLVMKKLRMFSISCRLSWQTRRWKLPNTRKRWNKWMVQSETWKTTNRIRHKPWRANTNLRLSKPSKAGPRRCRSKRRETMKWKSNKRRRSQSLRSRSRNMRIRRNMNSKRSKVSASTNWPKTRRNATSASKSQRGTFLTLKTSKAKRLRNLRKRFKSRKIRRSMIYKP